MRREAGITVRAVQPVVAALEATGRDGRGWLADAGVDPGVLADVEGRVPHGSMMALWQRARAETGDDHLGIHLAEAAPIRSFEVHAYAMLGSETLRAAYRRAARYQRLIHETTSLTFDEGSGEGVLRHALPGGGAVPRHPAEFLATLWVRFGRMVAGVEWAPVLVCFAHPAPAAIEEHARVFGAPVRFSESGTAMHVADDVLDRPNANADPGLVQMLDRYAESRLGSRPRLAPSSERVREWLHTQLPGGEPTATGAARALNLSVRSLHRSLRDEETTFRELLDRLRHERALSFLRDPRYSIAEVAFLLGFSELSSFYRAFRRWTGRTPAEFRESDPPPHFGR